MAVLVLSSTHRRRAALAAFPAGSPSAPDFVRGAVETHIFSGRIGDQPGKVGKGGFLSLLKILKNGSRRDDAAVIILQAKAFQRIGLKLFFQRPFAEIIIKIPVLQAVDAGPEPLFQVLDIYTAHQEGLVADNLLSA